MAHTYYSRQGWLIGPSLPVKLGPKIVHSRCAAQWQREVIVDGRHKYIVSVSRGSPARAMYGKRGFHWHASVVARDGAPAVHQSLARFQCEKSTGAKSILGDAQVINYVKPSELQHQISQAQTAARHAVDHERYEWELRHATRNHRKPDSEPPTTYQWLRYLADTCQRGSTTFISDRDARHYFDAAMTADERGACFTLMNEVEGIHSHHLNVFEIVKQWKATVAIIQQERKP